MSCLRHVLNAMHLRLSACHALLDSLLDMPRLILYAACHTMISHGNELVSNNANPDYTVCDIARGHEAGASKPRVSLATGISTARIAL